MTIEETEPWPERGSTATAPCAADSSAPTVEPVIIDVSDHSAKREGGDSAFPPDVLVQEQPVEPEQTPFVTVDSDRNDAHAASPVIGSSQSGPPEPEKNDTTSAVPVHHRRTMGSCNNKFLCASLGVVVVVAVIVLAVVFAPTEPEVGNPPIAVDFSTGVSLVTSYAVETVVRSRLARTKVTMEVANALDCSSIHAISLQLPLDARITSLKTVTDDGCTSSGDVKEIKEARESFVESASKGLPTAYVEARDSFTHSIQVALPPLGTSNFELVIEQLLKQRLDEVQFEVPFSPNEQVDSIIFDLMVEDTDGQAAEFTIDLDVPGVYDPPAITTDSNATVSEPKRIHLDIPDARQYELPKTIRGTFSPGEIPPDGLLFTDGRCFEHFFRPASLDAMPRNFVFVLDTSSSMNYDSNHHYAPKYDSKLDHAKNATAAFIDSLKPQDTFTIQTFGNSGRDKLWGSGPGTPEEKEDAKHFLSGIQADGRRTDLHEAILVGLLRAKKDAKESGDNAATILVLLSDGYATLGERDRAKIVEHILDLNEEGSVSIFTLGFQDSADMQLLDAIALTNGGVSASLNQGQDDFSSQISSFLESELGSVLMSDVNVEYSASLQDKGKQTNVYGETQTLFPIMADGYEVVVRGLVREDDIMSLNATVRASTMGGADKWHLSATPETLFDDEAESSLCFQSYAHDRITQLLRLYDASDFLGDELIKRLVTLANQDCEEEEFSKCVRAEALSLAIQGKIVAKGLTAMVTADNEKCMKMVEGNEICLDGTTPDGTHYYQPEYRPEYGDDSGPVSMSAPAPASAAQISHDYDEGGYVYAAEESASDEGGDGDGYVYAVEETDGYGWSGALRSGFTSLVMFSGWILALILVF